MTLILLFLGASSGQIIQDTFESRVQTRQQSRLQTRQRGRTGRQETGSPVTGVDFTGCVTDQETGLCCVDKEETVTTIEKEPILECTHKNTEQCHYTYVTQFTPSQEEVCEENFEKQCSM